MTKEEIQNLINTLSGQTAANSITPAMVGTILTALNEKEEAKRSNSAHPDDWFIGRLCAVSTRPTVEEELCVNDYDTNAVVGNCISTNDCDNEKPLLRALHDCWVEISGYITLRASDSYTADRMLNIYLVNEDGERTLYQSNTVHFTGTTQIFSVPISYMARMHEGDVLHLTHYSSSGVSSVGGQSWLNIKAYLI